MDFVNLNRLRVVIILSGIELYNYVSVRVVMIPCIIQVSVSILPYDKASELCGGSLPDYIPKVRR